MLIITYVKTNDRSLIALVARAERRHVREMGFRIRGDVEVNTDGSWTERKPKFHRAQAFKRRAKGKS